MEDILKRLLDAEVKAQNIITQAKQESDILVNETRSEVLRAEERFKTRIPEIHKSFSDKAEERANQVIRELHRRSEERCNHLKSEAQKHHKAAVNAVLEKLLDVSGSK